MMDILKIADEVKAERTYFDNELIALTFSIANLEKFVDKILAEQRKDRLSDLEFEYNRAEALQVKLETMQEVLDKLAQEPVGYVTDSGLSDVFNIGVDLDDGTPLYARSE
jgi:hypothetical protein